MIVHELVGKDGSLYFNIDLNWKKKKRLLRRWWTFLSELGDRMSHNHQTIYHTIWRFGACNMIAFVKFIVGSLFRIGFQLFVIKVPSDQKDISHGSGMFIS